MEKEKFLNSLLFKHIILEFNDQEIIEITADTADPVGLFLDITEDTYELDQAFFYLDESITSKVLNYLNYYRYNPKYKKGHTDRINEVISNLNVINAKPFMEKQKGYNRYLNLQKFLRKTNIKNKYELMYLLKNDVVVYNSLLTGKENPTASYLLEEASSYFLYNCKEIYEDENILNNSYKELAKSYETDSLIEKVKNKSLIKRMNKIKK